MGIEPVSSANGTLTLPVAARSLPVAQEADALAVSSVSASQSASTDTSKAVTSTGSAAQTTASPSSTTTLSPEALAQITQLVARDQKVRQHEAAHLAASGGLAVSGPSYTYQKGPDGVNYAVGGEVSIDTSPGRTPQETIDRARIIETAALAPADPSAQDRAVAAQAEQMLQQASAELARQQAQKATSERTPQARLTQSYLGGSSPQQQINVYA